MDYEAFEISEFDDEPETFQHTAENNFQNQHFNNWHINSGYRSGFGPRPPPPRFSQPGRGFGYKGPPVRHGPMKDDRIINYLLRCGVPKDTLMKMPQDLLLLFEPKFCGLCGVSLTAFPLARTHYVSKNHLKNQGKWISLNIGPNGRCISEAPFKSRDLYCELCDVHITSKVHAESHYAGKQHRGIVAGRKPTRNLILLQSNMKQRFEQLIRREKKHCKPTGEIELTKKANPVQGDLHCEICNSSVTCSEQMTMHLNGKRHLSKEKQYILKLMKGETSDKDDLNTKAETITEIENDDNTEAEKESEKQGQDTTETKVKAIVNPAADEDENDEDKDFDWTTEGEKWDDIY